MSVTGAGGFGIQFFGTSAAAPHAAAIAALLKSANPALTLAMVRDALQNTAIDNEAPGIDRDAGNGIIMTIFLWHLTAALIALAVLHVVGFAQPAGASALWWATRPAWIVCAFVPLAGLIALFGRFERPRPAPAANYSPVAVGAGAALLAVAVLGVASSNLADLTANKPVDLALASLSPVQLLVAALLGCALVQRRQ